MFGLAACLDRLCAEGLYVSSCPHGPEACVPGGCHTVHGHCCFDVQTAEATSGSSGCGDSKTLAVDPEREVHRLVGPKGKIATAQGRAFESGSVAEHYNFSRRDSGSSQVPNQSHGEGALEQAHPTSEKPGYPPNASQTPSSGGEARQGQKHGSRDAGRSGRPSPVEPGVLAGGGPGELS